MSSTGLSACVPTINTGGRRSSVARATPCTVASHDRFSNFTSLLPCLMQGSAVASKGLLRLCTNSAHISPADFEKGSLGSYKHGKKKVEDKGDYPSIDAMDNISIEHSMDCILEEPEVIIDVAQPPDTEKHVHQWLEYLKGKDINSGLFQEESYYTMDLWDFAGQHLYYASHPIFLSQRALCTLLGFQLLYVAVSSYLGLRGRRKSRWNKRIAEYNPGGVEEGALYEGESTHQVKESHILSQKPHFMDFGINVLHVFKQSCKSSLKNTEEEGKADGIKELQNKILEVLRQEPYMGEKIPI
ncbi:hypothetical protein pdam_00015684, partial [Pocillopora damicornis]